MAFQPIKMFISTGHHNYATEDKILVGDGQQYQTSLEVVKGFQNEINKIYEKLDKYSDEDLKAMGITRKTDANGNRKMFTLRINGTVYRVRKGNHPDSISFFADQYKEAEGPLGFKFSFTSEERPKEAANPEHVFSFSTEKNDLKGNTSGSYLALRLLHPIAKVKYDEKFGKHTIVYKPKEERPMSSGSDSTYMNEDGTPYKPDTFAATTYPNFAEANSAVQSETIEFLAAFNNALILLKGENNQPEQPTKTAGQNPALQYVWTITR